MSNDISINNADDGVSSLNNINCIGVANDININNAGDGLSSLNNINSIGVANDISINNADDGLSSLNNINCIGVSNDISINNAGAGVSSLNNINSIGVANDISINNAANGGLSTLNDINSIGVANDVNLNVNHASSGVSSRMRRSKRTNIRAERNVGRSNVYFKQRWYDVDVLHGWVKKDGITYYSVKLVGHPGTVVWVKSTNCNCPLKIRQLKKSIQSSMWCYCRGFGMCPCDCPGKERGKYPLKYVPWFEL